MGNLLKILSNNCLDHGHTLSDEIFIDFDNVDPKEEEREIYNRISPILAESQTILNELEVYAGAAGLIKKSIENPSDQNLKDATWDALLPLVASLRKFWLFSSALSTAFVDLLKELTSEEGAATHQLEQKQALARQLADLLHFTLKFDKRKMEKSQIQNDYSFFRRLSNTYSRMSSVKLPGEDGDLDQTTANDISFFYAKPTPMLATISDATVKFVENANSEDVKSKTLTVLATFANITKTMLEKHEFRDKLSKDTQQLCEQVMTAAIILYDHVHPTGAFDKKSAIDVKGAIKLLLTPEENDAMLNALRQGS